MRIIVFLFRNRTLTRLRQAPFDTCLSVQSCTRWIYIGLAVWMNDNTLFLSTVSPRKREGADMFGLSRFKEKKEDFRGVTIQRMSFKGQGLSGRDFSKATLILVDFDDGVLDDAKFIGTTLVIVSFRGASMQRTEFTDAVLHEVDFTGADLEGVVGLDYMLYAFRWV